MYEQSPCKSISSDRISANLYAKMSSKGNMLRPWIYVAVLFASQLVELVVLVAFWKFSIRFRYWVDTPVGTFSIVGVGGLAAFLVVILFSHPRSLLDLLSLFEFQSIRRGITYFALVAGFVLGITGVFLARIKMARFAETYVLTKPFIHQPGPEKYLLAIILLVGPIFEEIIMRGFLYRAFRKSYGISQSISAIVLVATLTHWGVMTASLWTFSLLAILQVVLCIILEKTRNLWNCIACHIIYNGTLISASLIGMS
jgi:membrane protease YdiL (CAAX protease family)